MSDPFAGTTVIQQRDWLGHAIQLGAIFVIIGLPVLIWGISTNATIVAMVTRVERMDRDAVESRAYQIGMTTQTLEINRQLATIAAQVADIRDSLGRKRP